jgi:hypothetical protein
MSNFPRDFLDGIEGQKSLETGEVELARYIAEQAHAFQRDKLGRNTISHLQRVVDNLISMPDFDVLEPIRRNAAISAAWLHDVLASTGTNGFPKINERDLLSFGIHGYAAELVSLLTRPRSTDSDELRAYYERVSSHRIARWVKWADLADNLNESRLTLLLDERAARVRRKYSMGLQALQEMNPEQELWFDSRIRMELKFYDQNCPVCDRAVKPFDQYPRYVCRQCASRVTDKKGTPIGLSNTHFSGGLALNGEAVAQPLTVYIDGKECFATEALLGGVVIRAK